MGWKRGIRFAEGSEIYLRPRVQTGSEAHPASYPTDTGDSTSEIERPGREADHSPPSSARGRVSSLPHTSS
jgi:hypothetical protein